MRGSFSKLTLYTLNFDGSHNNQAGKAGAGCIIRDNEGELVIAAAYNVTNSHVDYCDVAITEAVALRNGLKLAKAQNLKINFIKGDSEEVYHLVMGRSSSKRAYRPLLSKVIEEIKGMLDPFSKIELIRREANKAADKLAFLGSWLQHTDCKVYTKYDYDIPSQVTDIIKQEKSTTSVKSSLSDEEGSSLAGDIGTAGAVIAGVAMLTWGVSKLFFGEGSSSQNELKHKATKEALPWGHSYIDTNDNYVTRRQEKPDFFVLHYQGCDKNQLGKASAGCIIRDKHGNFVVATAYNLDRHYPNCHIAIAEAIALRNGLQLAKDNKIKLNLLLGKNEEVVDRVHGQHGRDPIFQNLDYIIEDIMRAMDVQDIDAKSQVMLTDKVEDNNEVAYKLAAVGPKMGLLTEIYRQEEQLPDGIAELIEEEQTSLDIFN